MISDLLSVQLDFIKLELEGIDKTIGRLDELAKGVKQWAVLTWAAAVGGALTNVELRDYLAATAAIPLMFWFVDTWYRRIQRKFIWRTITISRFLNDGRLASSIEAGHLVGLPLLDPRSRLCSCSEYESFVSWRYVLMFRSLNIFYLGMTGMSLALGVVAVVT